MTAGPVFKQAYNQARGLSSRLYTNRLECLGTLVLPRFFFWRQNICSVASSRGFSKFADLGVPTHVSRALTVPTTTYYYLLLPTTTTYYLLLPTSTYYYSDYYRSSEGGDQADQGAPPLFLLRLLACWLAGLLACWLAGSLARWLAGLLACWLAGWLAGRLAGWPAGRLAGWYSSTGPPGAPMERAFTKLESSVAPKAGTTSDYREKIGIPVLSAPRFMYAAQVLPARIRSRGSTRSYHMSTYYMLRAVPRTRVRAG